MTNTVSRTRSDVYMKLFQLQDAAFQSKYWKKWEPGLEAYKRMGYKVLRVVIVPVTEWMKVA